LLVVKDQSKNSNEPEIKMVFSELASDVKKKSLGIEERIRSHPQTLREERLGVGLFV